MKTKALSIYKQIRFFALSFIDKELTLFAASLSFYTIFTLVPLLLIILSILTALPSFSEYYAGIKEFIFSNIIPVQSELIVEKLDDFLKNSAKMGLVSFVAVFFVSMLFFQNFEYIVNKIFHAPKRTFWESLTTYWTLVTLTPLALAVSFYLSGHFVSLMESNEYTQGINLLPLFPYLIIWGLFFLIYQIAPNSKINPRASAISSFVVSIIFSISKNSFIYYILLNKSYTSMYGSFAIVMFLFLWIYISWIIFLYGLKLSYIIDRLYKTQKQKTFNNN